MELATILLISSLVLELALGVGLIFLWRRLVPSSKGGEDSPQLIIRKETDRLERCLDGKTDLILARLTEMQAVGAETQNETQPPTAELSAAQAEVWTPPATLRPRSTGQKEISETEHLYNLLSSPDFTSGVWRRMDGPFDVASALVLGFLAAQGGAEPVVEPHPSTALDHANHWDFLVLWSQESGDDGRRFLIPRNFSRYDPAIHDHLFRVLGGGPTLDNFIRELRQCAVLHGVGPLEGLIPPDLVERKGVLVV